MDDQKKQTLVELVAATIRTRCTEITHRGGTSVRSNWLWTDLFCALAKAQKRTMSMAGAESLRRSVNSGLPSWKHNADVGHSPASAAIAADVEAYLLLTAPIMADGEVEPPRQLAARRRV